MRLCKLAGQPESGSETFECDHNDHGQSELQDREWCYQTIQDVATVLNNGDQDGPFDDRP